jgi:hypothetical protein
MTDPWDHNGECLHCDEQGGHRADCPWLLQLEQQVKDLEATCITYERALDLAWAEVRKHGEYRAEKFDLHHAIAHLLHPLGKR